jgi:hypothetical protein
MSALDRLRQRFPKLDPDVIGTHHEECHTTHPPCAYLLGHDDGHAEGERAATTRIVRWLRSQEKWPISGPTAKLFADAIEKGDCLDAMDRLAGGPDVG